MISFCLWSEGGETVFDLNDHFWPVFDIVPIKPAPENALNKTLTFDFIFGVSLPSTGFLQTMEIYFRHAVRAFHFE